MNQPNARLNCTILEGPTALHFTDMLQVRSWKITCDHSSACPYPHIQIGLNICHKCAFLLQITHTKFQLSSWNDCKVITMCIYPETLKPILVVFWSTFIALQHLFMFKYQVDKEIYEQFLIQINQINVWYIGLHVKRSILSKDMAYSKNIYIYIYI